MRLFVECVSAAPGRGGPRPSARKLLPLSVWAISRTTANLLATRADKWAFWSSRIGQELAARRSIAARSGRHSASRGSKAAKSRMPWTGRAEKVTRAASEMEGIAVHPRPRRNAPRLAPRRGRWSKRAFRRRGSAADLGCYDRPPAAGGKPWPDRSAASCPPARQRRRRGRKSSPWRSAASDRSGGAFRASGRRSARFRAGAHIRNAAPRGRAGRFPARRRGSARRFGCPIHTTGKLAGGGPSSSRQPVSVRRRAPLQRAPRREWGRCARRAASWSGTSWRVSGRMIRR